MLDFPRGKHVRDSTRYPTTTDVMAPARPSGIAKRGRGRPRKDDVNKPSQSRTSKTKPHPQPRKATKRRSSQRISSIATPKSLRNETTEGRGRKRKAQATDEDEIDEVAPGNSSSRGRKRKAKDTDIDELEQATAETGTTRKYVQLAPTTKRIRQEVLQTWPEISSHVLEQIGFVLRRAKDEVVYTRRDPRRADEAQDVLGVTIRQLERSLATMKIPPQTKALHFNLDRLTESNEHVYREVTMARHSKQLLGEQVDIAQKKLEAEQESVNRLEKNAQQWRNRWRTQEKKQLHPLLDSTVRTETIDDMPDEIGLKASEVLDVSLLDTPDSDLAPLLEQLRRSLDTMQGNHAQVEGISEAVRHANAQQYDAL
ncbi:hypothetical protein BU24DRAFT_440196 [Aaosphaeria arxii CBS 175.79]|uniref:Uncharacterized protein n=1 Tax=Aaosphaeria arxii CBS 175.79 TaxID=1450172 RepID=A0A6A5XW93_9PLEO|nr:uncharacterized protein BU24DRAFT_440196 [Aaosphaeria arxii CBS 175.79]KAF2017107.1 hypothetical protein BU24DRAFT_440196 [Aaosphaeria arxii CBS 175.79]